VQSDDGMPVRHVEGARGPGSRGHQTHALSPCLTGAMDYGRGGRGPTRRFLLDDARHYLLDELDNLDDKRQHLEARMEDLKKELEEVDVDEKATRRLLELVKARQQVEGQVEMDLEEDGLALSSEESDTEVRGTGSVTSGSPHASDMHAPAAGYVSWEAAPIALAWCQATASPREGPAVGEAGGEAASTADRQGRGAVGAHLQDVEEFDA
jgi:hypothetical protein